jgi:hypothetical protein
MMIVSSNVRVGITLAIAMSLIAAVPPAALSGPREEITAAQRQSLRAGLQVAPKSARAAKGEQFRPNPALALVSDPRAINVADWNTRMSVSGKARAQSRVHVAAKSRAAGQAGQPVLLHDEEEPSDSAGSNDSLRSAEPVAGFGSGSGANNRARILGTIPDLTPEARGIRAGREDNGQLDRARPTRIRGVGRIITTARIGDGPHGSRGSGSGDFDFYALRSRAGLTVKLSTAGSTFDTVVALYDERGVLLGVDDDGADDLTSRLAVTVPRTGTYYALVAGFSGEGSLPANPRRSGSGPGAGSEGSYRLDLSSAVVDNDFYAVRLAAGDVLGATADGVSPGLTVFRVNGTRMVGAHQIDASALYPAASPLPGGRESTLGYVAEQGGVYAVRVDGGAGRYDVLIEVYRPGLELDTSPSVQTVFLDFDGARLNTGVWGGPGVRTLSPLSSFLARWGLERSQERELVGKIAAAVRENISRDLVEKGLNPNVAVRVLSSADVADPFGRANVARVVVGGTRNQAGIDAIGIAQYIDPGNYAHEDSALVLLDVLSGRASEEASLNHYLRSGGNRVNFVARAVANIISHEVGHLVGSFHTDLYNSRHSLMDAGGERFGNLYGVGPDGIGGTADDADVDFVEDAYSPLEGFTGRQNTLNVAAWGFSRGSRAAPADATSAGNQR